MIRVLIFGIIISLAINTAYDLFTGFNTFVDELRQNYSVHSTDEG